MRLLGQMLCCELGWLSHDAEDVITKMKRYGTGVVENGTGNLCWTT